MRSLFDEISAVSREALACVAVHDRAAEAIRRALLIDEPVEGLDHQ
jgi:hypothetical protein